MSFGKVTNQTTVSNKCNKTTQNYAKWIQIPLQYILKPKYVFEDIANDIEKRFSTSNAETERPLAQGKNKKTIWINDR